MDQPSNLLSTPDLSPLEQDVLDEYERLAENMKKVCRTEPGVTYRYRYNYNYSYAKKMCMQDLEEEEEG